VTGSEDRTLTSRFELKYLLDDARVDALRAFIAPFTRPDPFAAGRPDLRYEIASLYFDTADLLLREMTRQGIKNRFKLRIRCYDDDPASPVFLEVKRRVNRAILKHRAKLTRSEARRTVTGLLAHDASGWERMTPEAQEFMGLVAACAARPVCRVRYRREAYEARSGGPLRISLDTEVEFLPTSEFDVALGAPGWCSSRIPGTILEIKYTDAFPPWVSDLVRRLGIGAQSVAKYVLSMDCLHRERPVSAHFPAWAHEAWPGAQPWIR
jgi:hypothetical protein